MTESRRVATGIVDRHTSHAAMSTKKVAISFRVSLRVKHLLETAAAREHRSQASMFEKAMQGQRKR